MLKTAVLITSIFPILWSFDPPEEQRSYVKTGDDPVWLAVMADQKARSIEAPEGFVYVGRFVGDTVDPVLGRAMIFELYDGRQIQVIGVHAAEAAQQGIGVLYIERGGDPSKWVRISDRLL